MFAVHAMLIARSISKGYRESLRSKSTPGSFVHFGAYFHDRQSRRSFFQLKNTLLRVGRGNRDLYGAWITLKNIITIIYLFLYLFRCCDKKKKKKGWTNRSEDKDERCRIFSNVIRNCSVRRNASTFLSLQIFSPRALLGI